MHHEHMMNDETNMKKLCIGLKILFKKNGTAGI
jgi:hypothetical protein